MVSRASSSMAERGKADKTEPPKIPLSWVATAASNQRGIQYDARPTDQLWQRYRDLAAALEATIGDLERLVDGEMLRLRLMLRSVTDDRSASLPAGGSSREGSRQTA